MNSATMTVNLVADPERHEYTTGDGEKRSLTALRVAQNERLGDRNLPNGFFDVTVFGPQAKNVLESLKKGDRAIITGRFQHTTFEREDGSKGGRIRFMAEAVAASLEFNQVTIARKPREEAEETA